MALWRMLRNRRLVQSIYELGKELENLFGFGEGTRIMRAVAAHTGEALASSRAPGGTRKVALLTGAPGGILRNFKTYVNGLWARVGWVQAGHQNHSISSLLEKGRRLADTTLVTFALLARDFFGRGVASLCSASAGHG